MSKKDKPKDAEAAKDLPRKKYAKKLKRLHAELVKVQLWAKKTGHKMVIVFEGRDAAGKGGAIKAITERVSPRVFRVTALPAPSEREKTQMYIQRYLRHFPAAGEIVIFDRSWYNRAGVERVMEFCTREEYIRFLQYAPIFERAMVDSGIQLIKYWLDVDMEEQEKRFRDRIEDPRKIWKLSPMDVKSFQKWYEYSRARDDMLTATDNVFAPWYIVDSNHKRRARLNLISHLLSQIDYEDVEEEEVELGGRSMDDAYDDKASLKGRRFVPAEY
jgi:polyphosphate kinase 2